MTNQILVSLVIEHLQIPVLVIVIPTIEHLEEFVILDEVGNRLGSIALEIVSSQLHSCRSGGCLLGECARLTHLGLGHNQRLTTRHGIQIIRRGTADAIHQDILVDQMRNGGTIDVRLQADHNGNLFKLTFAQVIARLEERFQIIVFILDEEINQSRSSLIQFCFNLNRLQIGVKFLMHEIINLRISLGSLNDGINRDTQTKDGGECPRDGSHMMGDLINDATLGMEIHIGDIGKNHIIDIPSDLIHRGILEIKDERFIQDIIAVTFHECIPQNEIAQEMPNL